MDVIGHRLDAASDPLGVGEYVAVFIAADLPGSQQWRRIDSQYLEPGADHGIGDIAYQLSADIAAEFVSAIPSQLAVFLRARCRVRAQVPRTLAGVKPGTSISTGTSLLLA